MALKSYAELTTRALKILGVIGAGQTATVENSNDVVALIVPMLSRLSDLDEAPFFLDGQIVESYFEPLAVLLAQEAAPDFGQSVEAARVVSAEASLAKLRQFGPSYETLATEYF
jgi:hypothetical protein